MFCIYGLVQRRKFNFRWRGPPDSSVSSIILVGWCEERQPATKKLAPTFQPNAALHSVQPAWDVEPVPSSRTEVSCNCRSCLQQMHEQSPSSRCVWGTAARIGAAEAGRNIRERRFWRGLPWLTRRRVKHRGYKPCPTMQSGRHRPSADACQPWQVADVFPARWITSYLHSIWDDLTTSTDQFLRCTPEVESKMMMHPRWTADIESGVICIGMHVEFSSLDDILFSEPGHFTNCFPIITPIVPYVYILIFYFVIPYIFYVFSLYFTVYVFLCFVCF